MRPIFLRSMRLPSGTIEDRLSVCDCSDARGGNPKSNGLARTRFSAQQRKESLPWQVRGGSGFWCSPSGRQTEPWNPPRFQNRSIGVIESTVRIEPMTTIQNILFPVDFSPSCVAMAAYVMRAAAMFGAKVTLLRVFDLYSHDAFQLYVRPLSEVGEEQQNLAREKLDSFLKSEFPLSSYS